MHGSASWYMKGRPVENEPSALCFLHSHCRPFFTTSPTLYRLAIAVSTMSCFESCEKPAPRKHRGAMPGRPSSKFFVYAVFGLYIGSSHGQRSLSVVGLHEPSGFWWRTSQRRPSSTAFSVPRGAPPRPFLPPPPSRRVENGEGREPACPVLPTP